MATAKLHHSVSRLLQHTIASFCRERVTFARKLRVVGLVALTIDDEDADVLMKMDETFVKDGNGACEEDDDEDEDETEDRELHAVLDSRGDQHHVDSSTAEDAAQPDDIFAEEAGEEADTNFCLLEDEEVMPLPPPLSSVIDRLRGDVNAANALSARSPPCTAGSNDSNGSTDRIQICTTTSIVTPLFHHKQKRKRFKPMRHGRHFNGLVSHHRAAGSHSSEEPPSPDPYPSSNGAAVFPLLGDVDPKADDLPLPPLPSSDTASGGEELMELNEGPENQAILLNGIDCSTTCSEDAGDMMPMSPVPGDIVEDVDDEELQITGEDCRPTPQPLLPASLPPPPPPPPPPQLTAVTLPLLSLPLTGATALNSIPLIPLRQVTSAQPPTLVSSQPAGGAGGGGVTTAAPRQFALLAPGTGILLPSASGASATAPAAAAFLATATKSLTLTAVPAAASANSATSTTNSASMSLTSANTAASAAVTVAAATKTKALTCATNSISSTRSRRSTLKIHHSPLPIPAAAAALRPLPTMTSSTSVASSLMRHYNCRYCGKTFNRKFCLERHERLHTGVKPYACSCCGERFIRLEDKKRHVRTVHEPQPPGCTPENSASASGDDGASEKSAVESCGGGGGGGGGGSGGGSSTSAHMLSIISAVAAAAAAASNGGTDRKVGAINER